MAGPKSRSEAEWRNYVSELAYPWGPDQTLTPEAAEEEARAAYDERMASALLLDALRSGDLVNQSGVDPSRVDPLMVDGLVAQPGLDAGEQVRAYGDFFVDPLLNLASSAPGLMSRSLARRGGGELPPLTPDDERAALDAALMGVAGPVGRVGGRAWRWLTQTPGLTRSVPGGWRTFAGGPVHGAPAAPVSGRRGKAEKLHDLASDPRTPAHEAAAARSAYENLTGESLSPPSGRASMRAAYEARAPKPAAPKFGDPVGDELAAWRSAVSKGGHAGQAGLSADEAALVSRLRSEVLMSPHPEAVRAWNEVESGRMALDPSYVPRNLPAESRPVAGAWWSDRLKQVTDPEARAVAQAAVDDFVSALNAYERADASPYRPGAFEESVPGEFLFEDLLPRRVDLVQAADRLDSLLPPARTPQPESPAARRAAFELLRGDDSILGPAEGLAPARDERIATKEAYTAVDLGYKPSSLSAELAVQRWAASDDMIEMGRFNQADLSLIRQLKKKLMKYDPRIREPGPTDPRWGRGERELGWVLSGFKAHSLSLPLNSPQSKAADRFGHALNAYEDLGSEAFLGLDDDALLSGTIDLISAARVLERTLASAPSTGRTHAGGGARHGALEALRAAYEARAPKPGRAGVREAHAKARPELVATSEEIPLGLSRPPVRDVSLEGMADDAFGEHWKNINRHLSGLERRFDEDLALERDPAFRRELAEAQDEWVAADMERFRRDIGRIHPESIFNRLLELRPNSAEDRMKMQIVVEEMAADPDPNVLRQLEAEFVRYGEQSASHAEVAKRILEDIKNVRPAPAPAPSTGRPALRAAYEAGKPEPVAPEPQTPTQTPAQTGAMESVPVEALESNESFREWIRSQSRGGNKEIIKKLQGELNDIRASQESAPGEVLYHGTGRHVADQIESEGFSLSTGRRSGPFGDTKEIQNQAVFLSPQKDVARSYGQNKYERDDVLLTAKVNAQKQLDFTDPSTIPSDLRKKALEVVREYEGPSVARLRQEDIHWLIDQQGFAQALRDRGYDSVRFLESSSTSKSLGLDRRGETVAVLDPAIISLEPKNRGGLAWSREQIMKGRSPSPPPPTRGPFDPTTTDMPFIDNMLKDPGRRDYFRREKGYEYHQRTMTPQEYLDISASGGKGTGPDAGVHGAKVADYAARMRQGESFPTLVLDWSSGRLSQEGRHRALAAIEAGVDEVPVVEVFPTDWRLAELEDKGGLSDAARDRLSPPPTQTPDKD